MCLCRCKQTSCFQDLFSLIMTVVLADTALSAAADFPVAAARAADRDPIYSQPRYMSSASGKISIIKHVRAAGPTIL